MFSTVLGMSPWLCLPVLVFVGALPRAQAAIVQYSFSGVASVDLTDLSGPNTNLVAGVGTGFELTVWIDNVPTSTCPPDPSGPTEGCSRFALLGGSLTYSGGLMASFGEGSLAVSNSEPDLGGEIISFAIERTEMQTSTPLLLDDGSPWHERYLITVIALNDGSLDSTDLPTNLDGLLSPNAGFVLGQPPITRNQITSASVAIVPEPSAALLLSCALFGCSCLRTRRI